MSRGKNEQTAIMLKSKVFRHKPMTGNPEGWAAGIIYALVNQDRQACGVPGLLNSEFSAFFGVTMGTIRPSCKVLR